MSLNQEQYDGIVIGTGQGGKPLAAALARAGWKTAIVECGDIGGTCVNVGCTPTKTMVASARVAYLARRASDYGVQVGSVSVDLSKVRERKRAIVESWRSGSERGIAKTKNLSLVLGTARFVSNQELEVDLRDGGSASLSASKIFINTGERPARPELPGLDDIQSLTSTSIMELDAIPEHLVILGGGYIGLEFGQMFRRFGSRVTIIHRGAQLLSREDSDIADAVADIFNEDGIDVLLNADARSVKNINGSNGGFEMNLKMPEGNQNVAGSHLLLATGRTPNTDMLHPEAAGIQIDSGGYIRVNDSLETTAPGVYVLGDVKGGPAFTHIAYDDYRILRENMLNNGKATITNRLLPYTVFIDPQLGRVGLTEKESKENGLNFRVARLPMARVARALEVDESRGFMKAILDADSGQILGFAMLGIEAGEVAGVIQMAMMGKVPYTAIRDSVFSHPTLTESLNNLFMSLDQ